MTVQARPVDAKEKVYGFWISQCLSVVARLGIADLLNSGPKTAEELALLTESHAPSLYRLMRALTSVGIFAEDRDSRFSLTPLSQLLRNGVDGSLDAEIHHVLHQSNWDAWGQLHHSIKTGEAAFPKVYGQDVWSYRAENQEAGAIFDRMAMTKSREESASLIDHLRLEEVTTVVDLGGGNGAFLNEILTRYPHVHGILFDQPQVVQSAAEVFKASDNVRKSNIVSGNFFVDIPKSADLYLLKAILHNWSDEKAVEILQNCRKAMKPEGRIVIIESVLDPNNSRNNHFMDLHMLVIHGGRERTAEEFRRLLESARLNLTDIIKTTGSACLLEASPV